MITPAVARLDTETDMAFETLFRKIERIGWQIMVFIVITALLGLLGNRVFSEQMQKVSALQIEYDYFERQYFPATLAFNPQFPVRGRFHISVSTDMIHAMQIEEIVPEPAHISIDKEFVDYEFDADSIAPETKIWFYYRPQKNGLVQGIVRYGKESMLVQQYVYP